MKFCDLDLIEINKEALKYVSKELCDEYKVFPYDIKGRELYLATPKEFSAEEVKYLGFLIRKSIKTVVATPDQIQGYINKYYEENYRRAIVSKLKIEKIENNKQLKDNRGVLVNPIISLVDSIIKDGVIKGASDIHIEPSKDSVRVRYRIDGILIKSSTEIPYEVYENISTRIKVMANMDISNKYELQDGEINLKIYEDTYEFRVSSLPTIYGEKFVMRILKKVSNLVSLDTLGFKDSDYRILKELLKFKQGLIVITGPTGSGKTSTLYAMVRELNKDSRNIITIEKPVECTIHGVNQVSIGSKGNLEYSEVLRSVLRQDPDVIMVGEIIDRETAKIAVEAAQTGHLVLTTLHTNDASSTINRLIDIGINRESVNDSLLLIVAQRLARTVCNDCKVSYEATTDEKNLLREVMKEKRVYKGTGCNKCENTGFKGRTIAYEIMVVGDKIKDAIKTMDNRGIRKIAMENGMVTLEKSFGNLVVEGITTTEEYKSNMQVYSIEKVLGEDYAI